MEALSEEIAQAIGTLDYWRDRAQTAETVIGMLVAELLYARRVIDAARPGFGSSDDLARAHGFDPRVLTATIIEYDALLAHIKATGKPPENVYTAVSMECNHGQS
jgi:hypothetical protein